MPQAIVAFAFPALTGLGATIATSLVGIGLSMGVSWIADQLFGPGTKKPEDMQGLIRQSVSPRMRHYGRVRLGGAIVFIETRSSSGVLAQVIAHGQGPFDGFEDVFIDNRLVDLENGEDGGVITAPYDPAKQRINVRHGTVAQTAMGQLTTDFPTIWTAEHRLRGIAYSLIRTASLDEEVITEVYPNRIPILSRVVRASLCFDPRSGTTAWTRNAALIMRDYLTHKDGMAIPASLIDDDLIKIAASVCDENVALKAGGTINRYAIGLSYSFEEEPKAILGRIINAADGRLFITSAGKIGFQVGKWIAPTVTISDEHVISYEMTDGSGPFRESNEVTVKFTHVDVGYKEATSDPWRDEASISLLGETRANMLAAYEIQHHNHARRIAKIVQARSAPRWQGTVITNLHGLNCWDQRWINLKLADLEIDGTFEIIGPPAVDPQSMTISLQVQSFEAGTYDFDAVTEEGFGPTIPEVLEEEDIPEPTGVVTAAVQRKLGEVSFNDTNTTVSQDGDGNISTGSTSNQQNQQILVYVATIKWAAAPREGLQADAQYSLNGIDWLAHAVAHNGTEAQTPPMASGATVRQRVRFSALGGARSDWVNGTNRTIPS